jgi:hypothetical protein
MGEITKAPKDCANLFGQICCLYRNVKSRSFVCSLLYAACCQGFKTMFSRQSCSWCFSESGFYFLCCSLLILTKS